MLCAVVTKEDLDSVVLGLCAAERAVCTWGGKLSLLPLLEKGPELVNHWKEPVEVVYRDRLALWLMHGTLGRWTLWLAASSKGMVETVGGWRRLSLSAGGDVATAAG